MATPAQDYASRVKAIREQKCKTTAMFVGAPGAGKSSLINSLVSLVDSSDESRQENLERCVPTAPPDLMGGHTMMRESIELTDNVTIVDNRGWQDWGNEVALQELAAQINGERSIVDKVDWEKGGTVYKKVSGMPLVVAEKINCLTVVINGKGGVDALQDFKKLIKTCNADIGRIPTVVVTHEDAMSDEEVENIQSSLEKVYGISKERIFIIQNMTEGDACLEDKSKLRLLDFLDRCIADARKATQFHETKEIVMETIIESQKEVEAEAAVRESEAAAREVEDAARDLELMKTFQEKMRLQIVTEKEKALAQIEEDAKREEQKHAQKMNREKEDSFLKTQLATREHTLAEQKMKLEITAKREKMAAQIEEDMKKDELRYAKEMNRQKEKDWAIAQKAALEKKNEQHQMEKKNWEITQEKKKAELKHEQEMNKSMEENWLKLKEKALKNQLEAEKHANELDVKEKAKFMNNLFNLGPQT